VTIDRGRPPSSGCATRSQEVPSPQKRDGQLGLCPVLHRRDADKHWTWVDDFPHTFTGVVYAEWLLAPRDRAQRSTTSARWHVPEPSSNSTSFITFPRFRQRNSVVNGSLRDDAQPSVLAGLRQTHSALTVLSQPEKIDPGRAGEPSSPKSASTKRALSSTLLSSLRCTRSFPRHSRRPTSFATGVDLIQLCSTLILLAPPVSRHRPVDHAATPHIEDGRPRLFPKDLSFFADLFSRRSRRSSSRLSVIMRPSARCPTSRSAWANQLRIVSPYS
jgi:hypothetical protein